MFVFAQGIQWAKNFEPKMFSLQLLWTKLNIISKNFKKRRENCNFKTNNFSSKSFSSLNSLEKNKHFEKKNCQKIKIFFFKNSKIFKNNYLKITITQKLRVVDPQKWGDSWSSQNFLSDGSIITQKKNKKKIHSYMIFFKKITSIFSRC